MQTGLWKVSCLKHDDAFPRAPGSVGATGNMPGDIVTLTVRLCERDECYYCVCVQPGSMFEAVE